MVTEADAETARVATIKVALVAPAGMVTLAGTVATAVLPLDKETSAPPLGACALRVTVPVEEDPPDTLVGLNVTDDSLAEVSGPVTTAVQEYKQSETARSPIATPISGRSNEFRFWLIRVVQKRSQTTQATIQISRASISQGRGSTCFGAAGIR